MTGAQRGLRLVDVFNKWRSITITVKHVYSISQQFISHWLHCCHRIQIPQVSLHLDKQEQCSEHGLDERVLYEVSQWHLRICLVAIYVIL
jgi:hypothetical protein